MTIPRNLSKDLVNKYIESHLIQGLQHIDDSFSQLPRCISMKIKIDAWNIETFIIEQPERERFQK